MSTEDDIDATAGTRRRAIAAKVLRQEYDTLGMRLPDHIRAAAAVLLALDEDDSEREFTEVTEFTGELMTGEALSVDQQIRMAAITAVTQVADPRDGLLDDMVDRVLANAEKVTVYMRDGKVGEET